MILDLRAGLLFQLVQEQLRRIRRRK
jgi:hypothetical protein